VKHTTLARPWPAGAATPPSPFSAPTSTLDLTADPANLTTGSFTIGTSNFRTGNLATDPFATFTIEEGDIIRTTLTLASGLTVPGSMEQLFGLNFFQGNGGSPGGYPPGAGPTTEGTLTFSYSMGPTGLDNDTLFGACGNCLTAIGGNVPGGPFIFDKLIVEQTITSLNAPFLIDNAIFSYQLRDVAVAVPEPATWLVLILGLGVIGTALRRRTLTSARLQLA